MHFEFATATRIIFGAGRLQELGPLAADLGQRAFLVTGHSTARAEPVRTILSDQGLAPVLFSVSGEPSTEVARAAAQRAQEASCDMVVGCGGGSALDAAQAVSALLTNGGDLFDYLEVIGRGQPLRRPAAPYIAIPTTAGTGTEVTRNAVLLSPEHQVKVSLRSALMLPRLALVDPELTYSMPPAVTASTGLDALTQVMEPYVSRRANPLTDALCREAMGRAARSLRRACEQGGDAAAREDMALVSLFGGLALANAGLGAAHGFAGPLGGMFPAPHGAVCATLLPHVMHVNVKALRDRDPHSGVLSRYEEMARILTGDDAAVAADGVTWVEAICRDLGVPGLSAYGVSEEDIPSIVDQAMQSSSMKGNPITLTQDEMREILTRAL